MALILRIILSYRQRRNQASAQYADTAELSAPGGQFPDLAPQPKHATSPLGRPSVLRPKLWQPSPDTLNIDISISTGNKAKTLPPSVWEEIFTLLACLPGEYYVFVPANEQSYLDALIRDAVAKADIVNLIGLLPFEDVPDAIRRMDCYIAIDSGNIYNCRCVTCTGDLFCRSQ